MRLQLALILTTVLCALPVFGQVRAVPPSGATVCDGVLVQNVSVTTMTDEERLAYLVLVEESTFEQAKKDFATSGAIDYIKLFTAQGDLSYSQFDERRRMFKKIETLGMSRDRALATLRRSVTDTQVKAWLECMRLKSMGLTIAVFDEKPDAVSVELSYRGSAKEEPRVRVDVTGGALRYLSTRATLIVAFGIDQGMQPSDASTTAPTSAALTPGDVPVRER